MGLFHLSAAPSQSPIRFQIFQGPDPWDCPRRKYWWRRIAYRLSTKHHRPAKYAA